MLSEGVAENIGDGCGDGGDFEGSWTVAKSWEWVGGMVVYERVNNFVEVVGLSRRGKGGDITSEVLAAGAAENSATIGVGGLVGNKIV